MLMQFGVRGNIFELVLRVRALAGLSPSSGSGAYM